MLDVNVMIRGLISSKGASAAVMDAIRAGSLTLLTSLTLVSIFQQVVNRPSIAGKYRITPAEIEELLGLFASGRTVLVEPEVIPAVARDPDDDLVLACAVEGAVDYIVSLDKDLLDLGQHQGIPIVTPAQLLEVLRG